MLGLSEERLVAEAFAVVALGFNIIGYRQHCMQYYRVYIAIAMLLLAVHFYLSGGLAASIGCTLAVFRNFLSLRYNSWYLVSALVLLHLALMVWQLWYLHDSWNIIIAYIAAIIFTVGTLRIQSAHLMRKTFLSAELLSIFYAVLIGSIFGTVYNIFNLCVIICTLLLVKREHIDKPS